MNRAEDNNGRTHEPSLRELTAELDGATALLKASVENLAEVMNERDRRYEDRFTAMDEKTSLALAGSEKAVSKAETATEKRFDAVNEFRGTLSDQATNLLPRAEASAKFQSYDEKLEDMKKEIGSLRESRSGSAGAKDERAVVVAQNNWGSHMLLLGLFSAASLIVAILAVVFVAFKR